MEAIRADETSTPDARVARAIEEIHRVMTSPDTGYPAQERAALRAAEQQRDEARSRLDAVAKRHFGSVGGHPDVAAARDEVAAAEAAVIAAGRAYRAAMGARSIAFHTGLARRLHDAKPHLAEVIRTLDAAFEPIVDLANHGRIHQLSLPIAFQEAHRIATGLQAMRRLINAD